jgi:hypothetical protein
MNGLFAPLAAYAANEVRGRVRRQVAIAVGYAVAGLGGLGILVMGLISLHRLSALRWGPFWADLAIAGLFLVVALGGWLYASAQTRAEPKVDADAQRAAMSTAAMSAAPVALSMMRRGGGLSALGALAAVAVGVLAGRAASGKS